MAIYRTYNSPGAFKLTVYGAVIAACFFVMFYMVRSAYRSYHPQPLNHERALERVKARQDVAGKAFTNLTTAGWVDQAKGIVRLPIDRAMKMTVEAYQNPEAAHSNLVARSKQSEKAAPVQSYE
jgi:hypothetical protein